MKRIIITGCGGYAAIGFTRCLHQSEDKFFLVGTDCDERGVHFGLTDKKYVVPKASAKNYIDILNGIIEKHDLEFLYAQPSQEIIILSENRERLKARMCLPKKETILTCMNKYESQKRWVKAGVPTAETIFIKEEDDLERAFSDIGSPLWIRAISGSGGKGCLLVNGVDEARVWIEFNRGWNNFIASEYLPGRNMGCDMIFKEGNLICSQAKERLKYALEKANPMGITGTTGVLKTVSDLSINNLAERAVRAIDKNPNGVFSVDMKADKNGSLNITEINPGRFLSSSVHMFYKSNFLLPYYFVKLAYNEELPDFKKHNPLPPNHVIIRQLDVLPIIMEEKSLKSLKKIRDQDGMAEIKGNGKNEPSRGR